MYILLFFRHDCCFSFIRYKPLFFLLWLKFFNSLELNVIYYDLFKMLEQNLRHLNQLHKNCYLKSLLIHFQLLHRILRCYHVWGTGINQSLWDTTANTFELLLIGRCAHSKILIPTIMLISLEKICNRFSKF